MSRTLTCKSCESDFDHVQQGRGRPPVYCPTCRETRTSKPRKIKAEVVTSERAEASGPITSGDTVIRPLKNFFKDRATAIKYGTPLKVISILGDLAYVQHPAEKGPLPAKLDTLVKLR